MKCPIDGAELLMTDRNDVEIDYCPKCRGVWLDRGELDKIIERAGAEMAPPVQARPREAREDRSREERAYAAKPYKKSKAKSFLGDLFDF